MHLKKTNTFKYTRIRHQALKLKQKLVFDGMF